MLRIVSRVTLPERESPKSLKAYVGFLWRTRTNRIWKGTERDWLWGLGRGGLEDLLSADWCPEEAADANSRTNLSMWGPGSWRCHCQSKSKDLRTRALVLGTAKMEVTVGANSPPQIGCCHLMLVTSAVFPTRMDLTINLSQRLTRRHADTQLRNNVLSAIDT